MYVICFTKIIQLVHVHVAYTRHKKNLNLSLCTCRKSNKHRIKELAFNEELFYQFVVKIHC